MAEQDDDDLESLELASIQGSLQPGDDLESLDVELVQRSRDPDDYETKD